MIDELKKIIEHALAVLMPGEKILIENGMIYGCNRAVRCEEKICTGKKIGGEFEYNGWAVTIITEIPGTRDYPPEYDCVEVYEGNNLYSVASQFIKTIFELKSEEYWQTINDELWAKQCDF